MIKIEKTDVFGWESAIRGMRNPMNSWDKSDSAYGDPDCEDCPCLGVVNYEENCCKSSQYNCPTEFEVGENDLKLMKSLSKAGSDHAKYLRYIVVQLDITAPLYWWKEFKTYRRGRQFMDDGDELLDPEELEMFIETNSCSTMHKIHSKEFTSDDFSTEHLEDLWLNDFYCLLWSLNEARNKYLETKDKKYWWQMITLLPSSYNQKRTVQLNYQVLKSMYFARKNHKLDEWREFCKWIENLPCSELITGEKNDE